MGNRSLLLLFRRDMDQEVLDQKDMTMSGLEKYFKFLECATF